MNTSNCCLFSVLLKTYTPVHYQTIQYKYGTQTPINSNKNIACKYRGMCLLSNLTYPVLLIIALFDPWNCIIDATNRTHMI